MTDQNEREWPSFGDILDELNSLGGLAAASRPREPEPTVAVDSAPAQFDPPTPILDTTPAWAEIGESVDGIEIDNAEPVQTSDAGDVESSFGSDQPVDAVDQTAETPPAIDWSNWEFQPVEQPGSEHQAVIFEFDSAQLELEPDSVPGEPLDSVATANAIETDLHELFSFVEDDEDEVDGLDPAAQEPAQPDDEADPEVAFTELAEDLAEAEADADDPDAPDTESNNVVPLHRASDDYTEAVVGLDQAFDSEQPQPTGKAVAAEFVGVAEEPVKQDDSWDYLRPDEDDSGGPGFWGKRHKLFGGDERKAKRSDRKRAEQEDELAGPPCPKCNAPGHVDLDDPIGGKLHLSCRSCDHVWSQFAEQSQESA